MTLVFGRLQARSLDYVVTVGDDVVASAWTLAGAFEARRKLKPVDRRAAVVTRRWTPIGYPAPPTAPPTEEMEPQ